MQIPRDLNAISFLFLFFFLFFLHILCRFHSYAYASSHNCLACVEGNVILVKYNYYFLLLVVEWNFSKRVSRRYVGSFCWIFFCFVLLMFCQLVNNTLMLVIWLVKLYDKSDRKYVIFWMLCVYNLHSMIIYIRKIWPFINLLAAGNTVTVILKNLTLV